MTGNIYEDVCCSLLAVTCGAAVNTTHCYVAMALHSVFSAFLTVTVRLYIVFSWQQLLCKHTTMLLCMYITFIV
jgi:hypothetical protein